MVVLDADDHGLAHLATAVGLRAVAGGPVTGAVELGHREGVDVQQRTGLGPFVATAGLTSRRSPALRAAGAAQDLPHRRAVPAAKPGQAHRPPVRLGPCPENRLLGLCGQGPRTRPGHRPARRTPHPAGTLGIGGLKPTIPSGRDRRRRAPHGTGDRARPTGTTAMHPNRPPPRVRYGPREGGKPRRTCGTPSAAGTHWPLL